MRKKRRRGDPARPAAGDQGDPAATRRRGRGRRKKQDRAQPAAEAWYHQVPPIFDEPVSGGLAPSAEPSEPAPGREESAVKVAESEPSLIEATDGAAYTEEAYPDETYTGEARTYGAIPPATPPPMARTAPLMGATPLVPPPSADPDAVAYDEPDTAVGDPPGGVAVRTHPEEAAPAEAPTGEVPAETTPEAAADESDAPLGAHDGTGSDPAPQPDPAPPDEAAPQSPFVHDAGPAPAIDPPMIIPIRAYYLTRVDDTLRSIAAQFLNTPSRWQELRSLNAGYPGIADCGPDDVLSVGSSIALPGDPLPWGKPDPVYLWTLAEKFLFAAWGREPSPDEVVPFWRGLTSGAHHLEAGPSAPAAIGEAAAAPGPPAPAAMQPPTEPPAPAAMQPPAEPHVPAEVAEQPPAAVEAPPVEPLSVEPAVDAPPVEPVSVEPAVEPPPLAEPYVPSVEMPPLAEPYAPSVEAPPLAEPYAPSVEAPPLAEPYAPAVEPPPLAEPYAPYVEPPPDVAPAESSPVAGPAPAVATTGAEEVPPADAGVPPVPVEPPTPAYEAPPPVPVEPPPTHEAPPPPVYEAPPPAEPPTYEAPPPPPPAEPPPVYEAPPPAEPPTYEAPPPPPAEPPPVYEAPPPPLPAEPSTPAYEAPPPPPAYEAPLPPAYLPPSTPAPAHEPVPGLPDLGPVGSPDSLESAADSSLPAFMPSVTGARPSDQLPVEQVAAATATRRVLAGTAVGDAMLLWQLGRLRRRRPQTVESAAPHPLEMSLQQTARMDSLRLIEAAMRQLRAVTVAQFKPKPGVLCVRTGTYGFEVLLGRPVEVPEGWQAASGGFVLELRKDVTLEHLDAAGQGPSLCPTLVPVGETAEGPLMLNLEEIRCLAISGPVNASASLLGSVVEMLGSSPLAGNVRIITVGVNSPQGPGWERIHAIGFDSPQLEHLLATALSPADAAGDLPLDVLVVGPGNDILFQRAGQVATSPGSRLVLVGATSSPTARWPWRIQIDEHHRAVIHPIAVNINATQAMRPELAYLLSDAAEVPHPTSGH